jgi:hypothetical protein
VDYHDLVHHERFAALWLLRSGGDHPATLQLITWSRFREYYDPRDGSVYGSLDFPSPQLLTLELSKTSV